MKCPVCDEALREIQKHGVSVDICPGCKGVWLDRGELEKIIDMAATDGPSREIGNDYVSSQHRSDEPRSQSRDRDDDHDYRERNEHNERGRSQGYSHRKKKGSWLGEIFESFGGD